jgi:Sulfotransferase domain
MPSDVYAKPESAEAATISWVASYPRSGNTWTRMMLASYLADAPMTSKEMIDSRITDMHYLLHRGRMPHAQETGPTIVKSHFLPDVELMRPYQPVTRKIVYLVRNPRDVIFSAARLLNINAGGRGEFAKNFIANQGVSLYLENSFGTWPQNITEWTTGARQHFPQAETLIIRYEDMTVDPVGKLHSILDFLDLGRKVDRDRVRRAVENSSMEKIRAVAEASTARGIGALRDDRPRSRFIGQGLQGQSLTPLGADVEAAYQDLLEAGDDFARYAKQFGYAD